MNKKILFGLATLFVIIVMINPVSALNPHPGGSGQPNQSCQTVFGTETGPFFPPGFNTDGFNLIAVNRYAGSGFHSNPDNPNAVSQYDVACFQNSGKL